MFEQPAQQHEITLPNGDTLTVQGTYKGGHENPTIKGTDSEGRTVVAVYETINDNLELVSLTINAVEQIQNQGDITAE
jgi:hypothetical protein